MATLRIMKQHMHNKSHIFNNKFLNANGMHAAGYTVKYPLQTCPAAVADAKSTFKTIR